MTDLHQLLDLQRALGHALKQDGVLKDTHELRTRHTTLRITLRHCLFLLETHLESRQPPNDFMLSHVLERAPESTTTN